jgi:hypothetical protein
VVYHLEIASNKHLSSSYLLFLLLLLLLLLPFFVRCHNEVWKVSGSTIISQIIGAPQPLCLTGLDPSTGPYSQVIADVCDVNNPGQQWLIDSTTNHIRLPAWPIDSQCLTLFSPPLVNAYLTIFGYAPGQKINVRDIWDKSTTGPFMSTFTTSRGIASHETLLLRLSNADVATNVKRVEL